MAILTDSEVLEKINSPKNSSQIEEAQLIEDALEFYNDYYTTHTGNATINDFNRTHKIYKQYIYSLLGGKGKAGKFKRFNQLFKSPTSAKLSLINDEYAVIHKASDRITKLFFDNPKNEKDFESYRSDFLHDDKFFSETVQHATTRNPNCVLVVGIQIDKIEKKPAPFIYLVKSRDFIDIEITDKSFDADYGFQKIEYFIYRVDENTAVAIDDNSYRRLVKTKQLWKIESSANHNLGITPCQQVFQTPLSSKKILLKSIPVIKALPTMEKMILHEVGREYLEMYGKYPIIKTRNASCDYREGAFACKDGFISRYDDERGNYKDQCPQCSDNDFWAGTILKTDFPQEEGEKDNWNFIDFVSPPVDILEYNRSRSNELYQELERNTIGISLDILGNKKLNDSQTDALFTQKKILLSRISTQIGNSRKFALDTCAKIRYGKDFRSSIIDNGDNFSVLTKSYLIDNYQKKINAGLPQAVTYYEIAQLIDTDYKDPKLASISKFIYSITPYPTLTSDQLLEALNSQVITREQLYIHENMIPLINRFESELMPISSVTSNPEMSESAKRSFVISKLNEYASNDLPPLTTDSVI